MGQDASHLVDVREYDLQHEEGRQFAGELVVAMLVEDEPSALGEVVRNLYRRSDSGGGIVDGLLLEMAERAIEDARRRL